MKTPRQRRGVFSLLYSLSNFKLSNLVKLKNLNAIRGDHEYCATKLYAHTTAREKTEWSTKIVRQILKFYLDDFTHTRHASQLLSYFGFVVFFISNNF